MKPQNTQVPSETEALLVLERYWGYTSFRPMQWDIIRSVLEGHDTLALLPTGGGKSICYQVPGLLRSGLCLVVSPLIALMKDQVEQLKRRGIAAELIISGMSARQIDFALDRCIYGNVRFLYVSPERLQTALFIERAQKMNIHLLAVDEAHCISQWGYEFRPAYLQIAHFRQQLPCRPVTLAVTASATPQVQQDICQKLQFRPGYRFFQKSFLRPNLSYSVFEEENKADRLLYILQKVEGSGILYADTRKRCEQLTLWLRKKGFPVDYYHAGLTPQERNQKQNDWLHNRLRLMVATNAFGMGIDKADVRLVMHLAPPASLEAYYQEAGRAGRDEKAAYAVLLYHPADFQKLKKQIERSYPPEEVLKRAYESLSNHFQLAIGSGEGQSFDFDFERWQSRSGLPAQEAYFALKALEQLEIIKLDEDFYRPPQLHVLVNQKDLYDFILRNPHLEDIIKGCLRLGGGKLLSEYHSFSLNDWAKKLSLSPQELHHALMKLRNSGIMDYQPAGEGSQLTFLLPRHPAQRLPLRYELLQALKENHLQKIALMEQYCRGEHCRSLFIAHYFGEKNEQTCGFCDHCIREKRKKNKEARLKKVKEQIKAACLHAPIPLEELRKHLKQMDLPLIEQSLEELSREGHIKITDAQMIERLL